MNFFKRSHRADKARGFTLVELLVVIGIIALLISILLPALNRAKAQAIKVQCAANLRTLGQALASYAAENKSKLPQHAGGASWIWDWAYWSRDNVIKNGALRKNFYCPDNLDTQGRDEYWWFSPAPQGQPVPMTKGISNSPGFSVLGYAVLIDRPGNTVSPLLNNRMLQDSTKPKRSPTNDPLVPTRSTDTEVITEAVTLNSSNQPYITGGLQHYTPHMIKGRTEGGNILFLDGHVDWRPFGAMKLRWQAGSNVNFYF